MTTRDVIEQTKRGADIIRDQVKADIHAFAMPVKVERKAWIAWMADKLEEMGFDAMAAECRTGKAPYEHAKVIAFETLYALGGYTCPDLCIPAALTGEAELTYWRAIAIAANWY